uniref:Uncharacterized protein n=1 Tax=Sphaerodactylus townsendi TaxID=933632 RepID=A0ACB8EEB4_9SAUR
MLQARTKWKALKKQFFDAVESSDGQPGPRGRPKPFREMRQLWVTAGKPRYSERWPESVLVHEEEEEEGAGPSGQPGAALAVEEEEEEVEEEEELVEEAEVNSFHQRISRVERLGNRLSRDVREIKNTLALMVEKLDLPQEGPSDQ